jgi:hypothetical protein
VLVLASCIDVQDNTILFGGSFSPLLRFAYGKNQALKMTGFSTLE